MGEKELLKNSKIKLSIYGNERIIIENYDNLMDISDLEIIIDDYKIIGDFLKIRRMDNYMIEINGKISSIIVGKE